MSGSRVSVVMPAFQASAFIGDALDSIREQTHPVDEVIVVDDGSTDDTRRLALGVAASWPAVRVLGQPNAGPSAARNTGIAAATGDLVTFLDADDRMVPDRIAVQVAHLDRNPADDIVFGQKRNELEVGAAPIASEAARDPRARQDYPISMMVRREVFARVGVFDPGRRLAEEHDWLSRALAAGHRLSVIDHVLVRRRLHGANLTQDVPAETVDTQLLEILRSRIADRRRIA